MKLVYVTGCLGFIGSYVTKACLDRGWYVRGIDKVTYAADIKLLELFRGYKNFSFEKLDINNIESIFDCDYFINCAAESHVDNSIVNTDAFMHSNVDGVYHILEVIKNKSHFKMPIFIHFSSDEVYGDTKIEKYTECSRLNPSNPYSASKAAGDMLITAWSRTFNIPYVIVRPSNNYGIGQYVEKLIPKACKFLSLGRKIPLHLNGTPRRTWLHAADTAEAIITIIEHNKVNEIYNISGDYEDSNINVVNKILKVFYNDDKDHSDMLDLDYKRPGADIRYLIDDSKIRELGWKPVCEFDDEIFGIVEYHKENFIW